MIVVLASRRDREAHRLVADWAEHGARLMTPDDLSTSGWRISSDDPDSSQFVARGDAFASGELSGVVTRLVTVTAAELGRVREADRAYAAREMSAFLGYWLSTLGCPVLNPPGLSTLCGPGWRDERWLMEARGLGIEVVPKRRLAEHPWTRDGLPGASPALADVAFTVIGDTCLPSLSPGNRAAELDDSTRRQGEEASRWLAALAEVPLLTVGFALVQQRLVLLGASPHANLTDPGVRQAMLEFFVREPSAVRP